MRKFFPVLAAAAFVMASSHAFAGTSVKASVVPVGGDPKQGNCFQGATPNLDGSCPNDIAGTAQVSGKKGIKISLKGILKPTATNKKDVVDNTDICTPDAVTMTTSPLNCYMTTVGASVVGLPIVINLPTLIEKGKAKLQPDFALATDAFPGQTLGLTGGSTHLPPTDVPGCGAILTGAAYSGPIASAVLAGAGLAPGDVAGIYIQGIAFDGAPPYDTTNPCQSGDAIGVAGILVGN
ncbi:MAG: hypothetical protein U0842_19040 [Candidatus Binatia bacterium]